MACMMTEALELPKQPNNQYNNYNRLLCRFDVNKVLSRYIRKYLVCVVGKVGTPAFLVTL